MLKLQKYFIVYDYQLFMSILMFKPCVVERFI